MAAGNLCMQILVHVLLGVAVLVAATAGCYGLLILFSPPQGEDDL